MRHLRGLLWMVRRFGLRRTLAYERERRYRIACLGRPFAPLRDGERLLRAIGATEEQISRARERGLA